MESGAILPVRAVEVLRSGHLVSPIVTASAVSSRRVGWNGIALEAQLDNVETCACHGYPMGTGDPLASEIVKKWNAGVAHE